MFDDDVDDDNDDEASDEEKDQEEKYLIAFNDCVRMTKYGNKVIIKLKAAQEEISSLKNELEQSLERSISWKVRKTAWLIS